MLHILETYFETEEGEDQNLAPSMDASAGAYAFGAPAAGQAPPGGAFNFGGAANAGAPGGGAYNFAQQ